MFYLECEECFDAAHFLRDYDGKCRNIHGHRWRVIAQAGGVLQQEKQTRGMVMDFAVLRTALKDICRKLDHSLIYEKDSLRERTLTALREESMLLTEVPFRPTAENFAAHFFSLLTARGVAVTAVKVYETPNNCAVYTGETECK
ncbi:6-pyruvoyl trahydropterin synthase family protein [Megasphaera vaginalis (ex Bordigoni et al. 2020)]|uniref:6-pyruvoyl trahydropterin synthase family protein n=1 Tax=Megasphaera vaginalis (ex Bordigoni et al. 2020) TaxID=2045301 RepID=UPI000C7DF876|nr:6-carboxytetrahydropterin synthase [Megasphaera vaginalis (ex Bordigoni et al. 2020)]